MPKLIGLQSSKLSVPALARALDLSVGGGLEYLQAVRVAGIGPAEAQTLSEAELEGPFAAAVVAQFVDENRSDRKAAALSSRPSWWAIVYLAGEHSSVWVVGLLESVSGA